MEIRDKGPIPPGNPPSEPILPPDLQKEIDDLQKELNNPNLSIEQLEATLDKLSALLQKIQYSHDLTKEAKEAAYRIVAQDLNFGRQQLLDKIHVQMHEIMENPKLSEAQRAEQLQALLDKYSRDPQIPQEKRNALIKELQALIKDLTADVRYQEIYDSYEKIMNDPTLSLEEKFKKLNELRDYAAITLPEARLKEMSSILLGAVSNIYPQLLDQILHSSTLTDTEKLKLLSQLTTKLDGWAPEEKRALIEQTTNAMIKIASEGELSFDNRVKYLLIARELLQQSSGSEQSLQKIDILINNFFIKEMDYEYPEGLEVMQLRRFLELRDQAMANLPEPVRKQITTLIDNKLPALLDLVIEKALKNPTTTDENKLDFLLQIHYWLIRAGAPPPPILSEKLNPVMLSLLDRMLQSINNDPAMSNAEKQDKMRRMLSEYSNHLDSLLVQNPDIIINALNKVYSGLVNDIVNDPKLSREEKIAALDKLSQELRYTVIPGHEALKEKVLPSIEALIEAGKKKVG